MFSRNAGGGGGGGGRSVCKFFLEGRCKFGDSCKNEHPRGQQNQSSNRFAPLSNGGGGGGGSGDRYRPKDNRPQPFQLDRDNIRRDVTTGGTDGEKPIWPLSAYGPGKDAPLELIDAEFEKSPEELRVLYYMAKASGNPQTLQEYEQGEMALVNGANVKAQYVLNNLDSAIQYVLNGENTDKDRNKQTKSNSTPWQKSATTSLSNSAPAGASSGFGMQSGSQARPSGFAAFGQTSQPVSGAFGQPSALGGSGASAGRPAFGAPSISGAQSTAFGASVGARPAFGTPSTFGATAEAQGSTFGASSAMGSHSSPFAAAAQSQSQQPDGFGTASGFGNASTQSSAFGVPGPQEPTFGTSTFGQSAQPSTEAGGGFGQASQNKVASFGQASQPRGVGGLGQASGGTFGQTARSGVGASPFAPQPQQNSSPFGQTSGSNPQPTTSAGFGAPAQLGRVNAFGSQPQPSANAFGNTSSTPTNVGSQGQANGIRRSSDTTRDSNGKLLRWKGFSVKHDSLGAPLYQNPSTGKPERIWIEKGQPPPHPDFESPTAAYEGEKGRVLKELYDFLGETDAFKDGLIPETPPKREWIRWDV